MTIEATQQSIEVVRVPESELLIFIGEARAGFAEIRFPSGEIVQAELHWYEATGIGKREMKIKAFI